ncbi:MAG: hypothetical protein PVI80_20780 [Anaerolineae bacterium]|jgi:hypothetical protein
MFTPFLTIEPSIESIRPSSRVILTRVYLEMAGYPQLGNSVLHIAHAL